MVLAAELASANLARSDRDTSAPPDRFKQCTAESTGNRRRYSSLIR